MEKEKDSYIKKEDFLWRHIGPRPSDIQDMLLTLGWSSLDQMIQDILPPSLLHTSWTLPKALSEDLFLKKAAEVVQKNKLYRSFIGQGYYETLTPSVIQRNVLENPGWYTAYTPYQAEISQGRLEALLNFQTLITELTAMDLANSSLLDEATAAAEAMALCWALSKDKTKNTFFVHEDVFKQILEVLKTRAEPLDIKIVTGSLDEGLKHLEKSFAVLLSYPEASGALTNLEPFVQKAQEKNTKTIVVADLLGLTLLKAPGEWGADVVVGSCQRFGVPMGYGGPHAAYFATKEAYKRQMPGRLVGVSKDSKGKKAFRLALQTREQHIRREKATSNICTAQVLLAIMASMYAVYHGPKGLKQIALNIHKKTKILFDFLKTSGMSLSQSEFFDTLEVKEVDIKALKQRAEEKKINLFFIESENKARLSLDEATNQKDLEDLAYVLTGKNPSLSLEKREATASLPTDLKRETDFLTHRVFNSYHSETELLRYMSRLEKKDLTLNHSMIPLGSCTMKLNATTEMIPLSWPKWNKLHPFVPLNQAQGYKEMIQDFEMWLKKLTGFAAISFQPNAGSQGEYAGLIAIALYHQKKKQGHRNICLIPASAHGTNPATAVMAGFKVVVVACDDHGNVDMMDLKEKLKKHKDHLGAFMMTYPSTHGVFEETVQEICEEIHKNGGQVYLDGANLNALLGICRPAELGCDVAHLNLHKTFCIPHGGGGPGVGPIGVASHLKEFLPSHHHHPELSSEGRAISAAPWGSASILTISWAYCLMMGGLGLKKATEVAILNANYIAHRLKDHYSILYTGRKNAVAHECIVDFRSFQKTAGITVDDIAKRLMDYGFHAPTMSWPVAGTLMIEPTESESKEELERFCEALISIREEIREIEEKKSDPKNNVLKKAPHTIEDLTEENWTHSYSKEKAFFPLPWVKEHKFWTPVNRIDNAYGDRNLFCSCS